MLIEICSSSVVSSKAAGLISDSEGREDGATGGDVEGFNLTGLSGGLGEKGSSSVGIAVGDTMGGGVFESE